jgi:hypothetical protein
MYKVDRWGDKPEFFSAWILQQSRLAIHFYPGEGIDMTAQ